jgi:hypothetical protein
MGLRGSALRLEFNGDSPRIFCFMVRWLYILSVCEMLAACGLCGLLLNERGQGNDRLEEIVNRSDAIQRFRAENGESGIHPAEDSPLVVQAKALAPAIRPAAPSAKFTLHGTSYYPNQPRRSMALICEAGSVEGSERWVKEGAQVGHFVIQEIRHNAIVCRDGEQLREIAVEQTGRLPGIVRDVRPGARQVGAAVAGVDAVRPTPAGPNGIETSGGN